MNKKFITWECCNCRSRGNTQEGYFIRCDGEGCESRTFKILEIYEVEDKIK